MYCLSVSVQVKTLSFITYLLRGQAEFVRPHKDTIPVSVVQLLISCPHDSLAVRKELLVATRHILATDFRDGFFKHVDIFLDERVLIGAGRGGAGDALRPLAYSLLAEVVHHVRLQLTMVQLSRAVHLFARNVHDASLPLTVWMLASGTPFPAPFHLPHRFASRTVLPPAPLHPTSSFLPPASNPGVRCRRESGSPASHRGLIAGQTRSNAGQQGW